MDQKQKALEFIEAVNQGKEIEDGYISIAYKDQSGNVYIGGSGVKNNQLKQVSFNLIESLSSSAGALSRSNEFKPLVVSDAEVFSDYHKKLDHIRDEIQSLMGIPSSQLGWMHKVVLCSYMEGVNHLLKQCIDRASRSVHEKYVPTPFDMGTDDNE